MIHDGFLPNKLRDDLALIAAEVLILSNIQQEDFLEILYSVLPEARVTPIEEKSEEKLRRVTCPLPIQYRTIL